jgi:2OG-Fe dioxygenase
VSADLSPAVPVDVDGVRARLTEDHYVLLNDKMIGLPSNFRESFHRRYFNDCTLRHDEGDLPADRKRARDVVGYEWRDGHLHLREHDAITLIDRAGIPGKREHSRVWLLDDPEAEKFVRTFLSLVPPERRRSKGTFGINLFRTYSKVVTKPHNDDEEFVMLYVLDRIGSGAESYLYRPEDVDEDGRPTAEPLARHQLNPGEILVFEDRLFKHGATPLEPPADGEARRDVLVCTVDYRTTYLEPAA